MIELRIHAETSDELYKQVRDLYLALAPAKPTVVLHTTEADYHEPEAPAPVEEHKPIEEAPKPAPVQEGKTVSADEVRAALNNLRKAKGIAEVKAILSAHGAGSFPELPADQYAAVLEEANAAC